MNTLSSVIASPIDYNELISELLQTANAHYTSAIVLDTLPTPGTFNVSSIQQLGKSTYITLSPTTRRPIVIKILRHGEDLFDLSVIYDTMDYTGRTTIRYQTIRFTGLRMNVVGAYNALGNCLGYINSPHHELPTIFTDAINVLIRERYREVLNVVERKFSLVPVPQVMVQQSPRVQSFADKPPVIYITEPAVRQVYIDENGNTPAPSGNHIAPHVRCGHSRRLANGTVVHVKECIVHKDVYVDDGTSQPIKITSPAKV